MLVIDIGKSGFQNVLDLIVANNVSAEGISASNVTLGAVSVNEGLNNTAVTITAILDAGYSGDVNLTYTRPTLTEAHTVPQSPIEVDTSIYDEQDPAPYEAAVKAAIAAALQLRAEDFEFDGPVPVPTSENNPEDVDIVPVAGSYLYQGAAHTVTFAAIDVDIPLSDVITVTDLSGFTF